MYASYTPYQLFCKYFFPWEKADACPVQATGVSAPTKNFI